VGDVRWRKRQGIRQGDTKSRQRWGHRGKKSEGVTSRSAHGEKAKIGGALTATTVDHTKPGSLGGAKDSSRSTVGRGCSGVERGKNGRHSPARVDPSGSKRFEPETMKLRRRPQRGAESVGGLGEDGPVRGIRGEGGKNREGVGEKKASSREKGFCSWFANALLKTPNPGGAPNRAASHRRKGVARDTSLNYKGLAYSHEERWPMFLSQLTELVVACKGGTPITWVHHSF